MGSPKRHCSPRRGLRSGGNRNTPPRLRGQITPPKTPAICYQLSTVPKSNSPWRTQPSFTYNLRLSPNWKSPFLPPSPPNFLTPHGVDQMAIPTTIEEMDVFLSAAWVDDAPVSSEYSRKLSELHSIYTSKMTQIDRKEMEMLAQCQCLPTSSRGAGRSSNNYSIMGAIIRSNYADVKKKLKEEITSSILKLQAKSSATKHKQISDDEASPQRKGKSPNKAKKLPQKTPAEKKPLDTDAISILNKWFDEHGNRPYPNKKEKQDLARRCNMTINQLSTWFNNKRYRSNCTKTKTGKGKGKATKK